MIVTGVILLPWGGEIHEIELVVDKEGIFGGDPTSEKGVNSLYLCGEIGLRGLYYKLFGEEEGGEGGW